MYFEVSKSSIVEILNKKLRARKYHQNVLYREFHKLNIACVLSFNKTRVKKKWSRKLDGNEVTSYAHCKFNKKSKYTFWLNSSQKDPALLSCSVGLPDKPCLHNKTKHFRRHVRRPDRETYNIKSAKGKYNEMWLNRTPEAIDQGNFTNVPNQAVFNNIRHENNMKKRKDQHPTGELEKLQEEQEQKDTTSKLLKGYIRHIVVKPHHSIVCATEKQIQAYIKLAKEKALAVFIDATGGIVKKIGHKGGKRPLLYSIVAKGTNENVPVATFLTECHTAINIGDFLKQVVNYSNALSGQDHQPQIVNTVFSWAILGAALKIYNDQDISEYLIATYNYQNCSHPLPKKFTVVHLCSAHIMNQISRRIPKATKPNCRQFILGTFSKLIEANNYSDQKDICKMMITVLGSKYLDENVETSLNNFAYIIKNQTTSIKQAKITFLEDDFLCDDDDDNPQNANVPSIEERDTIKRDSPYYQDTKQILDKIETEPGITDEENPFYDKKFLTYLLDNVYPYLPLITSSFLTYYKNVPLSAKEKGMLTNATVESLFKDLKQRQMNREKKMDTVEIIPILYNEHQASAIRFEAYWGREKTEKKQKNKRPRITEKIKKKMGKDDEKLEEKNIINISDDFGELTLEQSQNLEETWNYKRAKKNDEEGWLKRSQKPRKEKQVANMNRIVNSVYSKTLSDIRPVRKEDKKSKKIEQCINLDNIESFHNDFQLKALTSTPHKRTREQAVESNEQCLEIEKSDHFDGNTQIEVNNTKATLCKKSSKLVEPEEDLKQFDNNNWITDDVLHSTMLYHIQKAGKSNNICVFHSMHFQQLYGGQFDSSLSVLNNLSALNKDSIFAIMNTDLVHYGYHWTFLHIELNLKEIRLYNSFVNNDNTKFKPECWRAVKNFLIALYATAEIRANLEDFTFIHVDSPQQGRHGGDCGIFALHFAECILTGENFLSPDEIHKTRKTLKAELKDVNKSFIESNENSEDEDDDENKREKRKKKQRMINIAQEVCGEYNERFRFKETLSAHSDLNSTNRSQNWSICDKKFCCKGRGKQIFCVICRGWLHIKCLSSMERNRMKDKYFICRNCNAN